MNKARRRRKEQPPADKAAVVALPTEWRDPGLSGQMSQAESPAIQNLLCYRIHLEQGGWTKGGAMITIESSADINRPVEEVFSFVSDPKNEPQWHTDVLAVSAPERIDKGAEMTWTVSFMGRKDLVMEVIDYKPNEREQLHARKALMGMQPTITYIFQPAKAGTRFTRRVEMEPAGGWKVMTPMMSAMVKKRNASFVANLKSKLQT